MSRGSPNSQHGADDASTTELATYVESGEVDVFTPVWEYVYLNIAKHIAKCVITSRLQPGQRLPNGEALARYYGVSLATQRRAMQFMRKHGMVVTLHGKGTFIAPNALDGAIWQVCQLKSGEIGEWR